MKYTYQDMPDKSIEGIKDELHSGLVKIAIFMFQTMGFPIECFIDKLKEMDILQQLLFYMNFRNKHPRIFKN